jgi:cytochrome c556
MFFLNILKIMLKYISLILISLCFFSPANSELSVEEIIKGRKAIFSKNYKTAKRVQSFSMNEDFDKAKNLMIEMSKNYKALIKYFPENSKEGFKTEALPIIWEDKENFNNLMNKASQDMIKLAEVINDSEDTRGTLTKFMWSNCKACHNKYREEH